MCSRPWFAVLKGPGCMPTSISGFLSPSSSSVRASRCTLLAWALLSASVFAAESSDTRLLNAARRNDPKAVQALIGQKVDVNLRQPDGATALHWAAHWDDVSMAEALIRAGAAVNVAEEGGVTPLSVACANGSAAMVDRLLQAGASPNEGRESPVM